MSPDTTEPDIGRTCMPMSHCAVEGSAGRAPPGVAVVIRVAGGVATRRPMMRLRTCTCVPAPGDELIEKASDMRRTPGSPRPSVLPVEK